LPSDVDGADVMKQDERWRIVFGFNILLNIYGIIIVSTLFREPSLKDFLRREEGNKENLYRELKKIYIPLRNQSIVLDQIASDLTKEATHDNDEGEQVSWLEAYTSEKYRLTHWNSFLLALFSHFSGMAFVIMFLAYVLQEINKSGSSINIVLAIQLINLANVITAAA
jgi:hypothetical protein